MNRSASVARSPNTRLRESGRISRRLLAGSAGGSVHTGKPGEPEEVGRVREAELREAAAVLGIREVSFLSYPDGGVDAVPAATAIRAIASHIRRIRPQVLVTFGPDGAYGHPDHIAVSQFATAAAVCAADASYCIADEPGLCAHRVEKLFYLAWRNNKWAAYQSAFRKLTSMVDGVQRQATPWPDWAVTAEIDTSAYWPVVWKAVCCHQTQMSMYERLAELTSSQQIALWGTQEFYRVYSAVNGGRKVETDLFEGLR